METSGGNSLMACNAEWLNTSVMLTNTGDGAGGSITTSNCLDVTTGWYTPYYYHVCHTSPARPIKLTLTEIEVLRKLAKHHAKIKAILQKFTEQIEITVDF